MLIYLCRTISNLKLSKPTVLSTTPSPPPYITDNYLMMMSHPGFAEASLRISHHRPQDLTTLLKLIDPILQKGTLTFCVLRLGHQALQFSIGELVHFDRFENLFKAADEVALDDLGSHIGDESFLLDLLSLSAMCSSLIGRRWMYQGVGSRDSWVMSW